MPSRFESRRSFHFSSGLSVRRENKFIIRVLLPDNVALDRRFQNHYSLSFFSKVGLAIGQMIRLLDNCSYLEDTHNNFIAAGFGLSVFGYVCRCIVSKNGQFRWLLSSHILPYVARKTRENVLSA